MRERAFIAWMAPRGSSPQRPRPRSPSASPRPGSAGGENLIPITFIVIVATALIYGLSGGPVARALGVASTGPGGVLLIGASPVGRAVGRALQDRGITVLVWTGDDEYASAAKSDGLSVYDGNPTEDASATLPPSSTSSTTLWPG